MLCLCKKAIPLKISLKIPLKIAFCACIKIVSLDLHSLPPHLPNHSAECLCVLAGCPKFHVEINGRVKSTTLSDTLHYFFNSCCKVTRTAVLESKQEVGANSWNKSKNMPTG